MSSFGPNKSRANNHNNTTTSTHSIGKGTSPSKTGTTSVDVIKTIREREVENRVKEIARLRGENEAMMSKIEEQDSEIIALTNQNQQLNGELEDVKKEYVDLERSFEESVEMLKQMKLKVKKEQEEKLAIQSELMAKIRDLEGLLADAREANRVASITKISETMLNNDVSNGKKLGLSSEHVHQYHLHLRDTLRVVADRLVEGLLRLDGDIDATAPLVNAYQAAQKDQSPLLVKSRDASNDFLYGKPSSQYAVAGTQIVEIDEEESSEQADVERQLWDNEGGNAEDYDEEEE